VVKAFRAGPFSMRYSSFQPFTYFPRGSRTNRLARAALRESNPRKDDDAAMAVGGNSIASADYDNRAFTSIIPMPRYCPRTAIGLLFRARGAQRTLAIVAVRVSIIQILNYAVCMDINTGKLRFSYANGIPLLRGSAFGWPFKLVHSTV